MSDTWSPGHSEQAGTVPIFSPNGSNALDLRGGNFALRQGARVENPGTGKVYWDAKIRSRGKVYTLQKDGDFVIFDAAHTPIWRTQTPGNPSAYLKIQNDQNLVLYDKSGKVLWAAAKGGFPKDHNPLHIASILLGIPPGVYEAIRTVDPQADRWAQNAIKTAGHAVEKVTHSIQDESGKIAHALSKIPVVGGLLHGLYDSMFFTTLGPLVMTEEVVVEGHAINKVVLAQLKAQLQDFKEVGPWVQMVCSFIPGVGTAISAALGCALALANGQPIGTALLDGVKGAVPGGPLAKMAIDMAQSAITDAIEHKKFTWQLIAEDGISAAAAAINLPDMAKHALEGAFKCTTALIKGERIDKALVAGVAEALPIPASAKKGMSDLLDMSEAIASGKRVDKVMLGELKKAADYLPLDGNAKKAITAGVSIAVGAANHEKIGNLVMKNVGIAMTDVLKDQGTKFLPKEAKEAIHIGIATVGGNYLQSLKTPLLQGPVTKKLMTVGQQILQSDPVVAAAHATVAKGSEEGFQVGVGLMRHVINVNELVNVREGLDPQDKLGFDLATSLHIGRVTNPASQAVQDVKAQVGHFITHGLQGATLDQKQGQTQAMIDHPVVKIGVIDALKTIAQKRLDAA